MAGTAESNKSRFQELVFIELMQEVEYGAPGARLSARLRAALERMSPAERLGVVSRAAAGGAPLLLAARRGNAEVVEYLVHVCGAPLEQRGPHRAPAERAPHRVTALWAAAVAGRLRALRVLADAGAELDARSDSGSTPLRSACFMTHLDTVQFLCARGADVHARNHNGGTCLINGVQCARLTRYLLDQGAEVDAQDAHGKTALHYAIQEHQTETARVLLEAGASAHVAAASGDDALQAACARGAAPVAELLLAREQYPRERRADALELLGATHLDEFNDAAAALACWRRATDIRYSGEYVPKRGLAAPCAALGGAREWRTRAELDALRADADAARAHAALVAVRVLGEAHRTTLFRLMYRGAWYADAGRFQRCVALWAWALRVRIRTDTLLHADTCHTLCALTRLLVDLSFASGLLGEGEGASERPEPGWEQDGGGGARGEERRPAPPHDVIMHVLQLVTSALPESQRLVVVRPWCAAQAEAWDRALRCVAHLALLAACSASAPAQRACLQHELARLVAQAPETHAARESLLHLVCSRLTAVRSAYFPAEASPRPAFPSARAARLLLAAGARARARDAGGRTPLHAACTPYNYSAPLVEALLAAGAHACEPDARGLAPADLLPAEPRRELASRTPLACLAARALAPRPAPAALPRALLPFLEMHRCPPPEPDSAP